MIEIPSKIEGRRFPLYDLERKLKPAGFVIGGGWEYEHGYFDYKLDGRSGYQFLRIPFRAVDGQLDADGAVVECGRPFLLAHEYEAGVDEEGISAVGTGMFNQFAEPEDKDADVTDEACGKGKALVEKVEGMLLP